MESIKNNYLFLLVVFCTFLGNAQEIESSSSTTLAKKLDKETILDQKNSSDDVKNKNNYLINSNIIQISQIGYSNYADVNIRSSNAKMTIDQDGSNNYLEVYKSAKQINQSFVQSGNNNFISDFSLYSGNSINMSLNQDGNNLSIFNNGSNSISKDLKITQTGNLGTIYIYNNR
jgi:hypothetical protein